MLLDLLRLFLFPALMAFAAMSDLMTMTISNRVSVLLIAGFFLLAVLSGMSIQEIGLHVAAGFAVLVLAFTCFALGWIGGGDAKVAASAALWFGFGHLLEYLVLVSLVGGSMTLLLISFRRWPLPLFLTKQDWLNRLHNKNSGVPYGIALAIGALLIYPNTEWIQAVTIQQFALR